ncbi:unnamed protein product [Mytilus edulis]|uniref:Uncharacterized protein n=1 Tax=Mytilus edulis TaxID=6550 RepID=A0A8S3U9R8_MYTED|nr:unnamed protein product [Mytilus edulis]
MFTYKDIFFQGINTTDVTTKQQTVNIQMEHIVTKDTTKYSKQTATSYTGLIVGGVVGAVLLIVVIVLVIVLKIRCKNATTKKENDNLFALSNGKSHIYEQQHRKRCSSNDKIFNNKLYDEQRLPSCKMVPDKNIRNEKDREDYNLQNYDFAVPIGIQETYSTQNQKIVKMALMLKANMTC